MKKVGSLRTSALLVGALVLGSFSPVDALQAPPTDTVVHELASGRRGTHATKTRGELLGKSCSKGRECL